MSFTYFFYSEYILIIFYSRQRLTARAYIIHIHMLYQYLIEIIFKRDTFSDENFS